MKKHTNLLAIATIFAAIFAITILFSACDNELKTNGTFKETPVVYGLLNWQDTAQYIRIERAFLDETTGATVLAADPSKIYFADATVNLLKIDNANNQVVQTILMQKVDGAQEGYPRAAGVFANKPNFLYKTKEALDTTTYAFRNSQGNLVRGELYRYRLNIISDNKEKKVYSAETRLVPNFYLSTPAANGSAQAWIVDLINPKPKKFEVAVPPRNGATFDIDLHFEYTEKDNNTGVYENKSFVWKLARNLRVVDGKVTTTVDPLQLYATLNSNIATKGSNIYRCGRSLKYYVYVYAAGPEYLNYSQTLVENTGVSSSDVIPQYTNVSEGRGFLSSRCLYKSDAYLFNANTVDSIAGSFRTSKLNFTRYSNSVCN